MKIKDFCKICDNVPVLIISTHSSCQYEGGESDILCAYDDISYMGQLCRLKDGRKCKYYKRQENAEFRGYASEIPIKYSDYTIKTITLHHFEERIPGKRKTHFVVRNVLEI